MLPVVLNNLEMALVYVLSLLLLDLPLAEIVVLFWLFSAYPNEFLRYT